MPWPYLSELGREKRISILAEKTSARFTAKCDVVQHDEITRLRHCIEANFEKIDFLVHSITFTDRTALAGRYIDALPQDF